MQELHEDILLQAVRGPGAEMHKGGLHVRQRHASEGGAIIVDTIEGATREAGEVIRAGIGGRNLVELGEIGMLKKGYRASMVAQKSAQHVIPPASAEADVTSENTKHHHGLGKILHLPTHSKDGIDTHDFANNNGGAVSSDKKRERSRDRASERERAKEKEKEGDGGLTDWLERGNVIFKGVGLGLMDIVVGMEIVRLAEERGVGTFVRDF